MEKAERDKYLLNRGPKNGLKQERKLAEGLKQKWDREKAIEMDKKGAWLIWVISSVHFNTGNQCSFHELPEFILYKQTNKHNFNAVLKIFVIIVI